MIYAKKAVFISYASEDGDAARRISETLNAAGIEVWFDQSALKSGDAWDQMIRHKIRESALLIPIISAHTNARTEGYFRREWKLAVDRTIDMADDAPFLLPVVIDDLQESIARVPDKFRAVHWSRLRGGEPSQAFVDRVLSLLAGDERGEAHSMQIEASSKSNAAPAAKSGRSRSPAWARVGWGLLVILFIAAGYAAIQSVSRTHQDPPSAATPQIDPAVIAEREKSIAVLPYVDMSPLKDQEYFADGMAEEVLDLLAKNLKIRVTSRTSSFQFKGGKEDLRSIGKRLNVAYVVEGTVLRVGSRIRVTSQLIETGSGVHLWADSQDRDFGDVLKIQQQIATGVARALQVVVAANDDRRSGHLTNTEAYTEYLKGLHALDSFHQASLFEAQSSFEHALALDPSFVRAAEALAHTHVTLALDESMSPLLAWQEARKAANAALALDPNSSSAHAVLGIVYGFNDFKWEEAEREIAIAIALKPRDSITLNYAARIAHAQAREDEALRRINAAISVDPFDPYAQMTLGQMLYSIGDLDGAEVPFRRSLEISPLFDGSHFYLGMIQLLRGDRAAAHAEIPAEVAENARNAGLTMDFFAHGRKAESDAALARLILSSSNRWPFGIAQAYAFRHEWDQTFQWLDRSFELRDPDLALNVRGDPLLVAVQTDRRYKKLLQRLNMLQ
jgi:TolB-like protein